MERNWQEPEIPRKKEIILKFVRRPQRVKQETLKIRIGAPARPFSDI